MVARLAAVVRRRPAASLQRTVRQKPPMKRLASSAPQRRQHTEIKKALYFGRRRKPQTIVVLLHGLNDSAKCCAEGVVEMWAPGLPQALLAVPQSPERTPWSTGDDPGYTWWTTKGMFPFEARDQFGEKSKEFAVSIKQFHKAILNRCDDLQIWLGNLLRKHGLTNRNLILAGFSQGSVLAALIGAKMNARGVIVCGGVPFAGAFGLTKLMPKRTSAAFCAVNGTKDEVVERKPLENMLRHCKCTWHWSKGVGHDFPDKWYEIELDWMQQLLGHNVV